MALHADLFARLRDHAQQQPQRTALRANAVEISYAALWAGIEEQSVQLRSLGITGLALLGDNHPAWLQVDLAARWAGVWVLPIPPFFTAAQAAYALETAQVDAVWSQQACELSGFGDAPQAFADGFLYIRQGMRTVLPAGVAKLTFTSGTTGTPKGVALSRIAMESVVASLDQVLHLDAEHTHLCVLPLAVLLENLAGVDLTLWMGGTVVVPTLAELGMQGSSRLDLQRFAQALQAARPQSLILTPQLLQAVLALAERSAVDLRALHFAAVGGATVSPYLLHKARAQGIPVYEGYGLSEMSSVVSLNTPGEDRIGSVGRVLPHVRLRMDAARNEILLHSPARFSGYLYADGRYEPASEWFATGDQGRLDADGFLHLSGRLKHQFITAFGRNVAPEWVERELLLEPEVQQAIVIGEARPHNLGLLVAAAEVTDGDIQNAVHRANTRLPDYAQIGDWIRITEPFSVEEGLWTGTGRPRRAAIEARYQDAIVAAYSDSDS